MSKDIPDYIIGKRGSLLKIPILFVELLGQIIRVKMFGGTLL